MHSNWRTWIFHAIAIIGLLMILAGIARSAQLSSDVNTSNVDPQVASQQAAWENYAAVVRRYFHHPDLQALRIVMAASYSHYYAADNPVWLFLVGRSGSGKTALMIETLMPWPATHVIGALTDKTLLSAARNGNPGNSLLLRLGSPILLAKDFTTILSMRPDSRSELVA